MHKLKEEENKLHKENKITLHKIKRKENSKEKKERKATSVCSKSTSCQASTIWERRGVFIG